MSRLRLHLMFALVFVMGVVGAGGSVHTTSADTPGKSFTIAVSDQKIKVKGRIAKRQGDVITLKTTDNREITVLISRTTSIKTKGGFLTSGKDFNLEALLVGLRVEVEGTNDAQGQLVAQKLRFKESDLEISKTVETRVTPVEERVSRVESANEELASQVDELNNISKTLRTDIDTTRTEMVDLNKKVNERISALDEYDVKEESTVYFKVNKYDLSPEAKQVLDDIAQKSTTIRGYLIEIAGYTDTTGSIQKNRDLSQKRADEVVRYMAENHNIPLRRMITPFGYGSARAVGDNTTREGRDLNRRVEVRILVNRATATE
ncbi:MAG TPA: OmpA family protein [Acidobacteriota bacterium]|nr:OmpA family protein [Acidobacteriota bacterium]HNH84752.1 OmpA family protein [Acidobacteriota bacterium]HNJ39468.1 OmpA family protein [Acidobacteriota bacterium]